jgi:hypothetical protein
MTRATEVDRFWVKVQLDLIELPRPDMVLEKLAAVDAELHRKLVEGERWLLRESQLEQLRIGWEQWLALYRRAVRLLYGGKDSTRAIAGQ